MGNLKIFIFYIQHGYYREQPARRGTARAGEPPARRCLARWWAVPTAMLTARASGSEGAASGFVSVDQLTPDHPVAGIPEKKMYARLYLGPIVKTMQCLTIPGPRRGGCIGD